MKSLKSAPLLVLSAWLVGSTSLYSPARAECTDCGVSKSTSTVKRSIFAGTRTRTTRTNVFPVTITHSNNAPAPSNFRGPIFGTDDCSRNGGPIFGENKCIRKKCGGAMFGAQTCNDSKPVKKAHNKKTTPRNAFIQNYKTIPSTDIYNSIHKCSDLAPIQLEWVDFRIQDGNSESFSRELGNYRFRLFGCRRSSKKAILNEGRIIQKNMRFIDIFEDIVSDCYKINKIPHNLCLSNQDYKAPEYILTAEITDYFMNVCDGYDWNKSQSEDKRTGSAEMTVTWRLMDLAKTKVLWKGETNGYSELRDGQYNGEIALIEQAFADAVSNLKGMPDFEQQLSVRINPEVIEQQKTTLLAIEQAADPIKCKVPLKKAETCPIETKGNATSLGGSNDSKISLSEGSNAENPNTVTPEVTQQCSMPAELIEYQYDNQLVDSSDDFIPLELELNINQAPYAENSGSICYGYNNESQLLDTQIISIDGDYQASGYNISCNQPLNSYVYPTTDNACENSMFSDTGENCDPSLISFITADIECVNENLEQAVLAPEKTTEPQICLFANDVTSAGGISKDSGYIIPEIEEIAPTEEIKQTSDWQPYITPEEPAIETSPELISEEPVVEQTMTTSPEPEKPACIENIAPYTEMNPENIYKVRSSMLAISNHFGKKAAGLLISANQILTSADIIDADSTNYKVETINGVTENARVISVNIKKNTALLQTNNDMYFHPLSINMELPPVGSDGFMSLGLVKDGAGKNYLDDKGSIKGYRFSDNSGTEIITDTFVQTVSAGGALIDEKGVITGFSSGSYKYNDNGDFFTPILDAINSVGLEVCGQTEPFAKAPAAVIKPVSTAIDSFTGSKEPEAMTINKRK